MATILQTLYEPHLSKFGLYPLKDENNIKNCGLTYMLDPHIGKGYYWIYPVGNLYAITIHELFFTHDVAFQCEHPSFVNVGIYESSIARMMFGSTVSHPENLLGYVSEGGTYEQMIRKNVPVRCVGVSFMPEFYKEHLAKQFSEDFDELATIFSKLNGDDTIPEVMMVLKQIRTFQPSKKIAKMYYDSKVQEIISLVMQWGEDRLSFSETKQVPDWEIPSLEQVSDYLEKNYAKRLSLNTLANIACMSRTKLTSSFKKLHGLTITEYTQSLRIEKAKELLLNSNWKIQRIAHAVGYKNHGSFSEMFKHATGFTPNEFRKQP
ncbi:helix-turn-helix domain-containing protein [Bacillus sp. Hm123]|uniref:helix-turn-helix domain-containing protein n=1 Tax=Bacillus sp. Hm123 TaxID=3450745 RepID=UPI003F4417B4